MKENNHLPEKDQKAISQLIDKQLSRHTQKLAQLESRVKL